MQKNSRSKNWCFLVYEEQASAFNKWIRRPENAIATAISPIHDKDLFDGSDGIHKLGDSKKPHRHVIWSFSGSKSVVQVKDYCSQFGVTHVEQVKSLQSYVRYLCHLDDDDKAKYEVSDVMSLNHFDLSALYSTTDADKKLARNELLGMIFDSRITSFSGLVWWILQDEGMRNDDSFLSDVVAHAAFYRDLVHDIGYQSGGSNYAS